VLNRLPVQVAADPAAQPNRPKYFPSRRPSWSCAASLDAPAFFTANGCAPVCRVSGVDLKRTPL
jgi:hypothetical protein